MASRLYAVLCSIFILVAGLAAAPANATAVPSGRSGDQVTKANVDGKTVYTIHVPRGAESYSAHIPQRMGPLDSKGCSGMTCVRLDTGSNSVQVPGQTGPLDAEGCSGWVCMTLDSTPDNSTYIHHWSTTALSDHGQCTNPFFLVNGAIVKTLPQVCSTKAGVFFGGWFPNRNYANGSQACTRWRGYATPEHKPCLWITN